MELNKYLKSLRLRTLPLSISGIVLGSFIALSMGFWNTKVFIFAILTTLSLQILSNLSNELGDTLNGTDADDRLGPKYSLQEGGLSIAEMKKMVLFFIVISILCGVLLLWVSFENLFSLQGLIMALLGLSSIVAALAYTLGKHPYGYIALGDLFVFLFFGLLSTVGAYFLISGEIDFSLFLPASAVGSLITGVLNLNNIRDIETDKRTRITIPILLGERGAKIYHFVLVLIAFIFSTLFCVIKGYGGFSFLFLLLIPAFVWHLYKVFTLDRNFLDKQFPVLVLLTIIFCLMFGIGILF